MEFVSPEAAADAIEAKQKGHLRHRYIECVLLPHSPREKHIKVRLLQDCRVYLPWHSQTSQKALHLL